MGMSAAERQARQRQRRKIEIQALRDQLAQAHEQVAILMVENERLKAESHGLRDELAQARGQIVALTAEIEQLRAAEPTKSRKHPHHEDGPSVASLRDRVSRGELVEMQFGSRSFFIAQAMTEEAYRIRDRYKAKALTKAEAFEALGRIAAA